MGNKSKMPPSRILKKRIYSGIVCEQLVYTVHAQDGGKKGQGCSRFKSEEEREAHRREIAMRKMRNAIRENWEPGSTAAAENHKKKQIKRYFSRIG